MDDTQLVDGFDRGECSLSFGDNVLVRTTPATEAAGIAGAAAQVMGETTPSVTEVTVIGEPERDYAVAVAIDESDENYWIDPNLLDFVDHGAGTTIGLKGVSKEWTRNAEGEWEESRTGFFARIKRWFRKGN